MKTNEPAIGICVVTFRRPNQLIEMLLQVKERTLYENYKIYIIIDHEDDQETLKELEKSGIAETLSIEKIEMFPSPAECVKATNRCYSIGDEPYFAWLSDDMEVERGWLREAMNCMQAFPDGEGLVTFQDGIQNGRNACTGLISRAYIKEELCGIFYNEIYRHFCADSELFRKSKMRDKVKHCPASIVWHNHPSGKGEHKSENDAVYMQSLSLWEEDKRTFVNQKKGGFMWNEDSAKRNFLEIKDILDSLKIKFYLNDGTLLGAIRHAGGFIPWDHDMDLRISAEDQGLHICKEFKKRGFICKTVILYQDLVSEYLVKKRGITTDIALNHYYLPEDVNVSLSGRPNIQNAVHPAKFYREDHFVDFLGTSVRVPNPPEECLEWIYGKDWRVPIKDKSWARGRERISLDKYIKYFIEKGIK